MAVLSFDGNETMEFIRATVARGFARAEAIERSERQHLVGQPICRLYPSCDVHWAHDAGPVELDDGHGGVVYANVLAAEGIAKCRHAGTQTDCPRRRATERERIEAIHRAVVHQVELQFPPDLRLATADHHANVTRRAVHWACNEGGVQGRCLVIGGFEGRGKSCAGAVVARILAERSGIAGTGYVLQWRRAADWFGGLAAFSPQEREAELRRCREAAVLVLDDCGTRSLTESAGEWLLGVITSREAAHRPMVITTRLMDERFKAWLGSADRCRGDKLGVQDEHDAVGPPIRSRLARWSDYLAADGPDLRRVA